MATRQELETALIAADAAGDAQAAQLFANEINALTEKIDFSIPTERALRTSSTTTPTKPSFQDILAGNFPAAKQYEAGYKQMPKYLQDPYLGLSTGTIGKVGGELFGLPEQIAQQGAIGRFVQPAIEKMMAENPQFASEFKPAMNFGELQSLHDKYVVQDVEFEEMN
jgi:hypothetical protein